MAEVEYSTTAKLPEWWGDYEPFDSKKYRKNHPQLPKKGAGFGRVLRAMGLRTYKRKWFQPRGKFPEHRAR